MHFMHKKNQDYIVGLAETKLWKFQLIALCRYYEKIMKMHSDLL